MALALDVYVLQIPSPRNCDSELKSVEENKSFDKSHEHPKTVQKLQDILQY